MERPLYSARLDQKTCLSEPAQCYHFQFTLTGENGQSPGFSFTPGQFVSIVAADPSGPGGLTGKVQNRAYSIASAPNGNKLDFCLNRVENGYFSNYLADMPVGETITLDGPHGYFVLKQPITDSIFIATGTGIAPVRGFTQWLFPEGGPNRSNGKEIWLVYGTRYESELYYREEFEALAAKHPNFHYIPTLSRASDEWQGNRGYVQEHVAKIVEARAAKLGIPLPATPVDPATPPAELKFDIHAYICGLNNMITSVRETLKSYGWHRKQIIFERYD